MTTAKPRTIPRPSRSDPRRYPLAPLLSYAPVGDEGPATPAGVLAARLALNCSHSAEAIRLRIRRWSTSGLSEAEADVVAVVLSLHPGQVWPEWWDLDANDQPTNAGVGAAA